MSESVFSEKLIAEALDLVSKGASLSVAARALKANRAGLATILNKKENMQRYMDAINTRASVLADEIIDIADDSSGDHMVDETGKVVVNHENIQRSRLRVDARKWVACKLDPARWGDKQEVKHSGNVGITISGKFDV